MDINRIDLSLLAVLIDLHATCSLTKTAKNLNKTNGAISKNLTRLRECLDDELFVRTQTGLLPTSFTDRVVPKFKLLVNDVHAILEPEVFDPARIKGVIRLASNHVILSKYGSDIIRELNRLAPNARFDISIWSEVTYSLIEEGGIDLGLQFEYDDGNKSIYQKNILSTDCSILARKNHPAQNMASGLSFPMVMYRSPGWNRNHGRLEKLLQSEGINNEVVISSSDLKTVMDLVEQSDMVTILPDFMATDQMKCIAVSEYDTQLNLTVITATSKRNSPLFNWLTGVIQTSIEKVSV